MLFEDIGISKVDINREKIKGFPEIIYGEYKTAPQIVQIALKLIEHHNKVLITRVSLEKWLEMADYLPKGGQYNEMAQLYSYGRCQKLPIGEVALMCAGTADLFVAEEARLTSEWMGCQVITIYDVGVAGLGRLLSFTETMRKASLLIVIAGMEGALPSVVSGLVETPVIAVPTSIGYGANLNGVTAMLAMLTSCSSGISVVNIDNGFGAAYQGALIIKLLNQTKEGQQ